ncbi:hypothetical protein BGZ82_007090 [Podila clonocystis]|nr:hypothetical protein BGZ82_007090 [Podila clonocystis]
MKSPISTVALSTTLAITLLALSTLDLTSAQRIAAALKHITVLGTNDLHSASSNERFLHKTLIRTAGSTPHAHKSRFWVDFHDAFTDTDRATFEQMVAAHPGLEMRHEFWESLNAVSIEVADEGMLHELVRSVPGIKLIEPVILRQAPKVVESSFRANMEAMQQKLLPKMSSHDITGVLQVHEKLGLYGKGIKIGIIDTGIDYTHPALGGCFGEGCKVAFGANFVSDKKGDKLKGDVMDCQGHGTHVAGIVAANDTSFIGVAPQATLGAYRVFDCKGATGNDVIIKAMMRAVDDGMDVINMSLGGPGGWRQEREARAVDILTRDSTSIFVIAMGNEGELGAFEASSPGVSQSAITVASMEARYWTDFYFTVDPALKGARAGDGVKNTNAARQILYTGDKDVDFSKKLVQLSPGTSGRVSRDGCSAIKQNVRGKIVLVRRGDCTFNQKMANVQKAGGSAVLFMDNLPNTQGFAVTVTKDFKIKLMGVNMADGEYLLRTIQANNAAMQGIKLVHGKGPISVRNKKSMFMSDFTSLGPDNELFDKPDITAPGGRIWSSIPVKMGKYATFSGTSMASPYIAGCVALYLEGHPGASNATFRTLTAVRTAFQNPAHPRPNQFGYKGYASVIQQGAGLINLWYAFNNPAIASPGALALNDTANMHTQHLHISNTGKETLTYKVDIIPATGLVPFYKNMSVNMTPAKIAARPSSVKISQRLVTVPPGENATVEMIFSGPSTNPKLYALYSGFVRLTPQNATSDNAPPVMHVPYMGMQGQYKEVPVFDKSFGLQVMTEDGKPINKTRAGRDNFLGQIAKARLFEPGHSIPHEDDEGKGDDDTEKEDGDIYVVYKLLTGAKVLVVDLVSPTGSDPRQVESFGVLKSGVSQFVPRTDGQAGNTMQVLPWNGQVVSNDGKHFVSVPKDKAYRMRISLLKHFGDLEKDEDFETFLSEPFTLRK